MNKREGDKFTIYTDGSCDNIRYPNYGGWAYLILEDDKIIDEKSGNEVHTTNNRMELRAIINSLYDLPKESIVTIYTDSEYCIKVCSNKYSAKANKDLIEEYWDLIYSKDLKVEFAWVKGHSKDEYNEIVDKMANDEYEKVSGKPLPDFKRLQNDKEYRKEIFKDYKKEDLYSKLCQILYRVTEDDYSVKDADYIARISNEILDLFKKHKQL